MALKNRNLYFMKERCYFFVFLEKINSLEYLRRNFNSDQVLKITCFRNEKPPKNKNRNAITKMCTKKNQNKTEITFAWSTEQRPRGFCFVAFISNEKRFSFFEVLKLILRHSYKSTKSKIQTAAFNLWKF